MTCRTPHLSAALVVLAAAMAPAIAQAPRGKPAASLPPPALTYRGLIPGRSTVEEVRKALGTPIEEHRWYAYKLLYDAPGRPGHLDAVHLRSSDGKRGELGCIEAASIPAGFESLEQVVVGLVNDELGYMLPGYDFNEGEYEESMSVGPAIGPMVRDLAIRMAEAERDASRQRGR